MADALVATSMKTIMGDNGDFVFSGYIQPELKDRRLRVQQLNVTEFGKNLRTKIPEIRRAMTNGGKFTMAVPIDIAASCHQYEHYVPIHGDGCGPACQAYGSGC